VRANPDALAPPAGIPPAGVPPPGICGGEGGGGVGAWKERGRICVLPGAAGSLVAAALRESRKASSPYVGNPRREEKNPESRLLLAHCMNPCT